MITSLHRTAAAALALGALAGLAGTARAEADDREYLSEATFEDGTSALAVRSSAVLGHAAAMAGGNTVWSLGKNLSAGIGFYTLATPVQPDAAGAGNLSFFYGGLELEAPLYTYRMLSLAAAAHAGIGQASYRVKAADTGQKTLADGTVRVFEPSLEAFVHATRRVDIGLAGGLRRVSKPGIAGVESGDLSSKVASVLLRGHF